MRSFLATPASKRALQRSFVRIKEEAITRRLVRFLVTRSSNTSQSRTRATPTPYPHHQSTDYSHTPRRLPYPRCRPFATAPNYDKDETASTSDPPILTWVDTHLPTAYQPYARLARIDKPIGTWLLLWPCFWSTAIAAPAGSLPDPVLLMQFAAGAFVMRGAGCTVNDLWDRNIDQQVARTAVRPLAAGDVSVPQAVGFLAAQLSVGLAVLLSLQPHMWYCFQWGAASLPLVAIYPATKRFFAFPQLVLGLTFNWGAWMGWAAAHGSMDWATVAPLYFSGVTWTLVYDTLYAHQDKHEDAKLGLQSTALTFGSDVGQQKKILQALAAATWCQWLMVGYQIDAAPVHFVGTSAAYAHLVWQIHTAQLEDPHNLAARFRSNSAVGALVFGSLAAGKFFAG